MDDTFNQPVPIRLLSQSTYDSAKDKGNELSEEDLAVLRAFDAMDLKDWEVKEPETSALKSTGSLSHPGPIPHEEPFTVSGGQEQSGTYSQSTPANTLSPDEMLALFVGEVDEDMITIQRVLRQLEPDDQLDAGQLQVLQRTAHKIKGTAGAIGCTALSILAHHMEKLIKLILESAVIPFIGLNALVQTARALELTLNSLATYGQESNIPLAELEEEFKALNIDIQTGSLPRYSAQAPMYNANEAAMPGASLSFPQPESSSGIAEDTYGQAGLKESVPFVRIELHRLEQLMLHTEQLAELSAPLENVQAEVEKALQELHTAQARLRYLETLLSTPLAENLSKLMLGRADNDERPTSSLVARILDESAERTGHIYQRSTPPRPLFPGQGERDIYSSADKEKFQLQLDQFSLLKPDEIPGWDALEINRFTESDVLIHSFNEAIADVATAASQLRMAFAQLNPIAQKYMDAATNVRNDTLLLRLTPMSTLIPRIERAIRMSALAQQRPVQFEVEGAATEIDQDILEELKHPLLQLVRTCVAHSIPAPLPQAEQSGNANNTDDTERIWLHVQASGNEVTIEVGFSLVVGGGGLDEVQEAIRRLNGSISVRRNAPGGISFYLRLPRSQGSVHCLLVRVGNHRVVVPFSHIQRIDNGKGIDGSLTELPVNLNTLLGFPSESIRPLSRSSEEEASAGESAHGQVERKEIDQNIPTTTTVRPVLILQPGLPSLAVQVDEVLGEVKLVVKPLAPHLRRQGIAGAAIDGMSNVLLMVDLPELLRRQETRQPAAETAQSDNTHYPRQTQKSILIADDSVSMRQSLLQTLRSAGYQVAVARNGIEALEHLLAHPPHILLLDIEMPHLNGYELLSIIHLHPELAQMKIAMLTSHSLEKHQERARELGAHAYLTKPCPQETLLEAVKSLLTS